MLIQVRFIRIFTIFADRTLIFEAEISRTISAKRILPLLIDLNQVRNTRPL